MEAYTCIGECTPRQHHEVTSAFSSCFQILTLIFSAYNLWLKKEKKNLKFLVYLKHAYIREVTTAQLHRASLCSASFPGCTRTLSGLCHSHVPPDSAHDTQAHLRKCAKELGAQFSVTIQRIFTSNHT